MQVTILIQLKIGWQSVEAATTKNDFGNVQNCHKFSSVLHFCKQTQAISPFSFSVAKVTFSKSDFLAITNAVPLSENWFVESDWWFLSPEKGRDECRCDVKSVRKTRKMLIRITKKLTSECYANYAPISGPIDVQCINYSAIVSAR